MWGTVAVVPLYLFIILITCCHGGIDSMHSQDSLAPIVQQCVAVDGYVSPYVRAFSAHRPPVVGCEAGRPLAAREVHVVNVLRDVTRVDGQPPYVNIRLLPSSTTGIHQGPLVVVLVAPSPVVWRVSSQRLSNTSRVVFWIRHGSKVQKMNQLRHKVKEEQLALSRDELLQWVTGKYRTVTSYIETPHLYTYVRKVGVPTARLASTQCVPTDNYVSSNVDVTFLEPRPTHACSVTKNEGIMTKDIHIIELLPMTNNTLGPTEVSVNISLRTRAARRRHLLLILKSRRGITWHIRTTGMRGDLDIMTQIGNTPNVVASMYPTVRVAMEDLTEYSGHSLRQWIINKEGPLVTYTGTSGADTINLIIDRIDSTAGRRGSAPAQEDQHIPGSKGPTSAGQPGDLDLPFINRSPFLMPARTKAALNQAKHVNCTSRSIDVVLRKNILRLHGIRQEHLSLLAPECMAAANSTHFILHTELNTCGTKQHINVKSVAYQNAILLHDIDLSDVQEDLGSADLSELSSLMASTDHTRVDDEDYNTGIDANGQIRIDFLCDYPIGPPADHSIITPENIDLGTGQPAQQVGDRHFNLAVYTDSQYTQVFKDWPLRLERDDIVFVQAEMSSDDSLHLILQNCWVGATKFTEPIGLRLIERGCERGPDVRIVQTSAKRVRFNFRYKELLTASRAFVGCQMALCAPTQASRTDGIPLCLPRRCVEAAPRPSSSGSGRNTPVNVAFTGPLDPPRPSWTKEDAGNRTPQDVGLTQDSSRECREVIRVEGLDSGTVVGISFAAFIIGVLLTAALWVIHTHTGPYRQANRPRSTETSGESTPSSTAPITIHHIHT